MAGRALVDRNLNKKCQSQTTKRISHAMYNYTRSLGHQTVTQSDIEYGGHGAEEFNSFRQLTAVTPCYGFGQAAFGVRSAPLRGYRCWIRFYHVAISPRGMERVDCV
eukprot:1354797-Amorphochlora_amoeboformis.AAC.1